MAFQLTNDQKKAIDLIISKYKSGEKYAILAGVAGVGKSTCVKHLVAALHLEEDEVAFAAPTGKAAQVLSKMGNKNCQTIHKLLYDWFPKGNGSFYRKRKSYLPYKLVVCDEISMVPMDIAKEMITHKECFILFCGDPEQLEPIFSSDNNHILDEPDIFLTEIMRQSLESDIIKLSMSIRHGELLKRYEGKDTKVLYNYELNEGMLVWADQVLCATNETRKELNQRISELKGYPTDKAVDGQKVICQRNYWNIVSNNYEPLVNGSVGYLRNVGYKQLKIAQKAGGRYLDVIIADIEMEDGSIYKNLVLDKNLLLTGIPTLTDYETNKIKKYYESDWAVSHGLKDPTPLAFEFGWCITVHKAQGSTYEKVLVIEEKHPAAKEEHRRWLYTAATRPSSKLVIIKK